MNNQQFDDIIKNCAQQREADVPMDIWEGISKKKKKKRFPFFWFILLGLLVGGAAIVWNLNNKKAPVQTATIEKKNEENKNTTAEKTTTKNEDLVLEKKNEEESNSINSDKSTAVQTISSVDKNSTGSNIITGSSIISSSKEKKPASNTDSHYTLNTDNKNKDSKNENSFIKNKTTHKTKGNSKIKITAPEVTGNENKSEENSFATKSNKQKTKHQTKITIVEPAVDSNEIIRSANSNSIPETTRNESTKPAAKDSLITEKKILINTDSSLLSKKVQPVPAIKKETKKSKQNGLKIELGFTAISPIQQYSKPLYVKRSNNNLNIQHEFISKEINTTVEPGAGFTIVFVKELNKKWSAGAGLQYLRFTELLQLSGTETHKSTRIVQRLVNDPAGSYLKPDTLSVITADSTTINGRNIYSNFSMPVFIRYNLISKKKWSLSFTGGVYIDLIRKYNNSLPGKFETMYTSGIATDLKSTIGVDLFMGLHFSSMLWKKMEWFAEPGFRYSLSNYGNNNLPFNKKIHKPGIFLGIKFPLK